MSIKIGPGGTAGLGYIDGLQKCKELNLNALECEFTYGVRMSNVQAKEIGSLAKKLNLDLSVHAPYYINLASKEKSKINASKQRILQSCERGSFLGAKYIVFHPGFYQGQDKEETFQKIKTEIIDLRDLIKSNSWKVELAPETTGKASQFGDLDELLQLVREAKCHLCVDFAHLLARNIGVIDYDEVFNKLKPIKHLHCHYAGIEWTNKGERRHIPLEKKNIVELFSYMKKYKVDATVICESPDPFADSSLMRKVRDNL